MAKVKNVEMLDYNGVKILVTGVLSEDGKYVSATALRKFQNTPADPAKGIKEVIRLKWKKSTSNPGTENCTLAMGDNATFIVKSLGEQNDEGDYESAELIPFTPTTQVTVMKHRGVDKVEGEPFVGSLLDWKIVNRNDQPVITMAAFLPETLVRTIKQSINLSSREKAARPKNADYAELSMAFTDKIADADPEVKPMEQKGAIEGTQSAGDAVANA